MPVCPLGRFPGARSLKSLYCYYFAFCVSSFIRTVIISLLIRILYGECKVARAEPVPSCLPLSSSARNLNTEATGTQAYLLTE